MPGNVRKLARASFNIRFILFHVVGSAANFSLRRGLFSRTVHKRSRCKRGMEGIREAGEERNRAANFLSKDYFPRAGN